jgi:alanyl-tRNA synthetase
VLPAFSNEDKAEQMLTQVDARAAHLEAVDIDLREWEKKNAKSAEADLRKRAATIANDLTGEKFLVANVPEADSKLLQAIVDLLKSKFKGPIFLAGASGDRVALIASVPKELTAKFQANKLIQEIAPIVGGKGGGRPEMAQGSGNDVSKIDSALAKARELLA